VFSGILNDGANEYFQFVLLKNTAGTYAFSWVYGKKRSGSDFYNIKVLDFWEPSGAVEGVLDCCQEADSGTDIRLLYTIYDSSYNFLTSDKNFYTPSISFSKCLDIKSSGFHEVYVMLVKAATGTVALCHTTSLYTITSCVDLATFSSS
jgi:hypothetical protein